MSRLGDLARVGTDQVEVFDQAQRGVYLQQMNGGGENQQVVCC